VCIDRVVIWKRTCDRHHGHRLAALLLTERRALRTWLCCCAVHAPVRPRNAAVPPCSCCARHLHAVTQAPAAAALRICAARRRGSASRLWCRERCPLARCLCAPWASTAVHDQLRAPDQVRVRHRARSALRRAQLAHGLGGVYQLVASAARLPPRARLSTPLPVPSAPSAAALPHAWRGFANSGACRAVRK
jgi:hypothetical protein